MSSSRAVALVGVLMLFKKHGAIIRADFNICGVQACGSGISSTDSRFPPISHLRPSVGIHPAGWFDRSVFEPPGRGDRRIA